MIRRLHCIALCVGALLLEGCAPQYQHEYGPFPHLQVIADSAMLQFFAMRTKQDKQESVQCVYGYLTGDSAMVAFIRPAYIIETSDTTAHYMPCEKPRKGYFGPLRYLGTFHNHPNGYCGFSKPDNQSFAEDRYAILDLVGCSTGTIVKHK